MVDQLVDVLFTTSIEMDVIGSGSVGAQALTQGDPILGNPGGLVVTSFTIVVDTTIIVTATPH
jgi:hypothetical protein